MLRRGAVTSVAVEAPGRTAETDALDDLEDGPFEELAVTSEGDVFIPDGHAVRIMALGEADGLDEHREDIEAGLLAVDPEERVHLRSLRGKPGQALQAGDLTAARLQRGAAGVVPWRIETLGRDGEYGVFHFETEEGARTALALLERHRIVRRPLDDEGRPIPPSAEDFEEGRRRYEETRQALVMDSDPGEGLDPGTYSDRR